MKVSTQIYCESFFVHCYSSTPLYTLGGIFMARSYVAGSNNGGDKYGGFYEKTVKL